MCSAQHLLDEWKLHTRHANACFDKHQNMSALLHYQRAIAVSEQLIDMRRQLADQRDVLATWIIGHQNLADFYNRDDAHSQALAVLGNGHKALIQLLQAESEMHYVDDALLWAVNQTRKGFALQRKRYPNVDGRSHAVHVPLTKVSQNQHKEI